MVLSINFILEEVFLHIESEGESTHHADMEVVACLSVGHILSTGKHKEAGEGGRRTHLEELEDKRPEPGHVRFLRPHVFPLAVPVTTDFDRLLVIWGGCAKSCNFCFILRVGYALSPMLYIATVRTRVLPSKCLLNIRHEVTLNTRFLSRSIGSCADLLFKWELEKFVALNVFG